MPTATKTPARRNGLVLSTHANDAEVELLLEMMRRGGHATLSGVVRTALWRYGEHLDLDVPIKLFKA